MSPVLRTSTAVLLAHVGVVWLVMHPLDSPTLLGANDRLILASVVTDMPAPMAQLQQPAPVRPTPPSTLQPQRTAMQSSTPPTVSSAVPSEAPPSTHAAPSFPTTSPASTGSARSTQTTAATVALPSSNADYLNNSPPAYPRLSRRMGEQGTVVLRVFINTEGRAEKAEVRTSSGFSRLDETALATVQRWRYVPGQRAGMAEAMWFNVPIRFVLD